MIKREIKNKICWITLNRPEASNAFNSKMIDDLCFELKRADQDALVNVIVLTGAGKHFCAGGDIKAMKERSGMFAGDSVELEERYQRGIQEIPRTIESLSKPIIAAINGAAVGAGLDMACMCDLRFASDQAKLGETFAKLALIPGDGGAYFLERVVGYAKAMELILTAKILSAKEALQLGLVNQVFASEDFVTEVQEKALAIASLPVHTLKYAKKALKQTQVQNLNAHLDLMSAYQAITQRTNDHFESLK